MRSFKTKHAGSMSLVGMERWLNSDQFKKKESLKRSKIDRFRAFFVLTTFEIIFDFRGGPLRPPEGKKRPKMCQLGHF